MRIADLIIKKRDGRELTDEEIRFFIKELVDGRLEGSQLGTSLVHLAIEYSRKNRNQILPSVLLKMIGAMLMAWFLKGMNARELATLTNTMTYSGRL